jgi:CoA:oxalate CoA-transferase
VIGPLELIGDARFADPETRVLPDHAHFLQSLLTRVFVTRDAADWEQELAAAGVPCGRVRDIGEVCNQAGASDRGLIKPTRIPGAHAAHYVNAGFKFAHDGPGAEGTPPLLGEHTREILHALGYDEQDINRLITSESVRSGVNPPQVRK